MNEPDRYRGSVSQKSRFRWQNSRFSKRKTVFGTSSKRLVAVILWERRQGVDGFEVFLGYVGLSGTVAPDIKKTVWEVSHIRNAIVHRASIADRKLVQSCPWLNYKIGERVKIPHEVLAKYVHTLTEYLIIVLKRLCVKYDVDYERKAFGVEDRASRKCSPGGWPRLLILLARPAQVGAPSFAQSAKGGNHERKSNAV